MTLTYDENQALFDLIEELTGGNPKNVFSQDGYDTVEDARKRACAKVYIAAGFRSIVPIHIRKALGEM